MDYTDYIKKNLNNCLTETKLNLPNKKTGKVRDSYDMEDKIMIITTDRQSAFDRVLASVPFKGQVLNQTSQWWFKKTAHIVPNHVVDVPDPNCVVAKKCRVFPVEFVVRGYMTGSTDTSVWTNYQQGVRVFCGNALPENMRKNQGFSTPIITPTSKSDEHDRNLTPEEIVQTNLMTAEEWDYCRQKSLELFRFGQATARQNGLILVDTKYEFGRDEQGVIRLIDEIHTPDSSRYWLADSYEERFANGLEPENIDKEFLRLWFKENSDPYHDTQLPPAPDELIIELSKRYIQLYEMITGEKFNFPQEQQNIHDRLNKNLQSYLSAQPTIEESLEEKPAQAEEVLATTPLADKKTVGKAIIIMGSDKDRDWVEKITNELAKLDISYATHTASAHKQAQELLQIIDKYKNRSVVYITVAGRSNALSGFVAGNSDKTVIACPPFKDKLDMIVNINSTLQMPSQVPVMTVLEPGNAALAVKRIFNLN